MTAMRATEPGPALSVRSVLLFCRPSASWASFTSEQSSFEIVTPSLRDGDTNAAFLRYKIHGSVGYGDGSVFVNGQRHRKL